MFTTRTISVLAGMVLVAGAASTAALAAPVSKSQQERAHAAALQTGEDTYADPPTGLTVLTAGYLARRGFCCDSGCRHCPYVT